ncbi:MAG: hypothetical protein HN368_05435, partial [Spirochaetales bacterium]|nr:hypothetical protein [Spirochaetales bacterium]
MKSLVRIALSLLISVVLFAAFAFIAFSGLFDYIESSFYDERIENLERLYVDEAISTIETYHSGNIQRYTKILQDPALQGVFYSNFSREQQAVITNYFSVLSSEFSGFVGVRIIDQDGSIHFSTFSDDYILSNQLIREYVRILPDNPGFQLGELSPFRNNTPKVLVNAEAGNFIYKLPHGDTTGSTKGTALFYTTSQGLSTSLVQQSILDVGGKYALVQGNGILLRYQAGSVPVLEQQIIDLWNAGTGIGEFQRVAETENGTQLLVYSASSEIAGIVGSIVNEDKLSLSLGLKILLLASFFLTAFLIVFLLLSIRQDRVLVLSDRIKKFQITFLREYIDKRDEINWDVWKRDLGGRKEEVRGNIKKGIGRIKGDKAEEIDLLIDKSWEEILDVIGTKIETEPVPQLEVKNLEDVIRKVVSDGSLLKAVSTEAAKSAPPVVESPPQRIKQPVKADDFEEVEELDEAEAVDDLEDIGEAESLEEIGEAEDLEEIGKAEEVEGLEDVEAVEELEEIGEAEEVEELDEAEAVDDLEEIGEAEEVE